MKSKYKANEVKRISTQRNANLWPQTTSLMACAILSLLALSADSFAASARRVPKSQIKVSAKKAGLMSCNILLDDQAPPLEQTFRSMEATLANMTPAERGKAKLKWTYALWLVHRYWDNNYRTWNGVPDQNFGKEPWEDYLNPSQDLMRFIAEITTGQLDNYRFQDGADQTQPSVRDSPALMSGLMLLFKEFEASGDAKIAKEQLRAYMETGLKVSRRDSPFGPQPISHEIMPYRWQILKTMLSDVGIAARYFSQPDQFRESRANLTDMLGEFGWIVETAGRR